MGTDCTLRAFFELRVSTSCVGLQACVIHTNMGHIVMEPICASRFRENRSITRSHHCSGPSKIAVECVLRTTPAKAYASPKLRLLQTPALCSNGMRKPSSNQVFVPGRRQRTNTRQVTWLYTVFFASFPDPRLQVSQVRMGRCHK